MGLPICYTRKLHGVRTAADLDASAKAGETYGEHAQVEGELAAGDHVALVDDVVSAFSSKEVALRQIALEARRRSLGAGAVTVDAVVVLIDREQGAHEAAGAAGVALHSIARLRSEGLEMLRGVALPRELEVIEAYLDDPQKFQDPSRRAELAGEARAWRGAAAQSG